MATAKYSLWVFITITVAIYADLIWTAHENVDLREELARKTAAAASTTAALKMQAVSQSNRANAMEANLGALLQVAQAKAGNEQIGHMSDEQLTTSLNHARDLAAAGKFQEALDEYLRLHRELQDDRRRMRVILGLRNLALNPKYMFNPALIALRDLRDTAMQGFSANIGDDLLLEEVALLNRSLDEQGRTVAVYDLLPPDDRRRGTLRINNLAGFVEERRYADVLEANPFGRMINELEHAGPLEASLPQEEQTKLRNEIIERSAANIEALLGTGNSAEAAMLTEKLLSYDGSISTQDIIQRHKERASQPPAN